MSSLTGTKIKDTYVGLLKTSDNGALGATEKLITDGLGNSSNLYMGTTGAIGIGAAPSGYGASFVVNSSSTGIYINNNGGTATFKMADAGVAEYSFTLPDGTGDFAISKGSSERMRIDSSGNVGINYNSPNISGFAKALTIDSSESALELSSSGTIQAIIAGSTQGAQILGVGTSGIRFKTSASGSTTERMRITSGGYLKASSDGTYNNAAGLNHELVSTGSGTFHSLMIHKGASPYGILINYPSASPNSGTDNQFLTCSDSTTNRLIIWSNGNVVNTNNSYGAISDAKLKENVVDATPKLSDLMQVQVRSYNLIGDKTKQLGVVAQELEKVFPSMVSESPDYEQREVELRDENGEIVYETEQVLVSEAIAEELDADGNIITPAQEAVYETVTTDRPVMTTERVDLGTTTKSVKYSVFVPMLIKAIQELKAEVDALKGA